MQPLSSWRRSSASPPAWRPPPLHTVLIRSLLLALQLLAACHAAPPTPAFTTFPFQWPSGLPTPLSYYWLADGSGFFLRDAVSGDRFAGSVQYEQADQRIQYAKPNWVRDSHFGYVISCGSKSTQQKDTLSISSVPYGEDGHWTLSWWFKDPAGSDFDGREREQMFGHGNGSAATSTRNQVHVQFENSGQIRTIVYDGSDIDRFPAQTDPNCRMKGRYTDPSVWTAEPDTWHMLTLTTRPDRGKGYTLYVDGVPRAASPYQEGVGANQCPDVLQGNPAVGGAPMQPVGPFRFCGRLKRDGFDDDRYFMGQLAHFAVFNSAMSAEQVQMLRKQYVEAFRLPGSTGTGRAGSGSFLGGIFLGAVLTLLMVFCAIAHKRGWDKALWLVLVGRCSRDKITLSGAPPLALAEQQTQTAYVHHHGAACAATSMA